LSGNDFSDSLLVLENDLLTKPLEKTGDKVNTISDLFELQKPIDFSTPPQPKRKEIISTRIIRNTRKAIWVKNLHHFRCQICGETIDLIDRNYSEAHHIKPLGSPHNGPDVVENIISVCPNHHIMLDYGAIKIDVAALKKKPIHRLNSGYIDYHNTEIYKGLKR